jgi:hypothetical protein
MSLLNDVLTNRHAPLRSSNPKGCVPADRPRPTRFAASLIKELRVIVFAITIFSAIMAMLAALDIWIWVPHLNR